MGLAHFFDDVGQLPELVEHAAQICDTGDLHREGHVGEVLLLVGPCLHGNHVDLVVGQHRGNVAQQAVAVDCDNAYVDGIGILLPAPLDLDEALRALVPIAQHVATIAAMDGDAAAAGDVADDGLAVLLFEPVLHLGTRTRGLQITEVRVEPVAARRALLDREQLHLLPRLQAVGEGYVGAVDLRAARAMTELGVDVIGEIERRGAVRQIDDVALGREHVYAVLELIAVVAAVAAMGDVGLPLQQLAQQGDLAIEAGIGCHAFFVAPVRSHAELRVLMHLVRADLHLYRAALRTDHSRVYRTVAVVLWRGYVVVELAGDVLPEPVHDTERRVAVAHLVHQHAHRAHIVDLAVVDVLAAHLAPDAVDVFGATGDLGLDAGPRERVGERLHELIDVALALDAALLQLARDLFINIRMQ